MKIRVLADAEVECEGVVAVAGHQVVTELAVDRVVRGRAADQDVVRVGSRDGEIGKAGMRRQRHTISAADGQRAAQMGETAERDRGGEIVADQLDRAAAWPKRAGVERGIRTAGDGDVASGRAEATEIDRGRRRIAGNVDVAGDRAEATEIDGGGRRIAGNVDVAVTVLRLPRSTAVADVSPETSTLPLTVCSPLFLEATEIDGGRRRIAGNVDVASGRAEATEIDSGRRRIAGDVEPLPSTVVRFGRSTVSRCVLLVIETSPPAGTSAPRSSVITPLSEMTMAPA